MPIQKFKYGQEITSAKLNEIVTFVNNLESFSNNAQFWNTNIDSKIAEFQTQLNNILNQVKNLLDTAENFDALLAAFVDLKSKYETLVTENVQTLLEQVFAPENFFVNQDGFVVINGIVTETELEGIPGPTGATGATGAAGTNGVDGKTILTGTTIPDNNTGTNGDIYFNINTFDFYLKANNVWSLIGNTKGPQGAVGPQGASAQILFRYQTDVGLAYLTQPPASNLVKFLEYKVVYSNETNQQIELKPWVRIQVRNDRFYPKLIAGSQNELLLSWTSDETEWSENPSGVNIKGPRGIDGINGTNGTNGTSVAILGSFASHLDLPESGATLGDGYIINGDLWVYTAGSTTGTPPAVNSVFRGFVNAGNIEGPAGPAPTIQAEVVATLNPAESASVTVVNTPEGSNNYRLNFSIPRGQTGTRGSLIFSVPTPGDLPTSTSFGGTTLLLNDLFIVSSTGEIRRLVSISPWDLALVYTAATANHSHNDATTSESGFMSAADKTKLNGVATNANNYSHPTYSSRSITTSGVNVLSTFTSDAIGSVTNITTRTLPNATTSAAGVMSSDDKTKLDGLVSNATHTGEVTGSTALTIANGVVTNAKLANIPANTIKGRISSGTGVTEDLNATQIRTIINVADGANNYTHPSYTSRSIVDTTGQVISSFSSDSSGHVTNIGTKNLGLADLLDVRRTYVDSSTTITVLNSQVTAASLTITGGIYYQVFITGMHSKYGISSGPSYGGRIMLTVPFTNNHKANGLFTFTTSSTPVTNPNFKYVNTTLSPATNGTTNVFIDSLNNSSQFYDYPFSFSGMIFANNTLTLFLQISLLTTSGSGQTFEVNNISMLAIPVG